MANKIIISAAFIPIVYFGFKAFAAQHAQYYIYLFVVLLSVNILLMLFPKKRFYIQYWLGVLFSFMFVDMVFYNLNLEEFIRKWKGLNFFILIPAVFISVLSCMLQTYRWKIILRRINIFKFSQLFPSVMVGHLANHIFPAKAGEFVKSYHLGKIYNYSKVSIFSTVVIERIFDGILVLSFFLLFLLGLKEVKSELILMGVVGFGIYGFAFIFIYTIYNYNEKIISLCKNLLPGKISAVLANIVRSFSEGLHILNDVRQLLQVMAVSIFMWFAIAILIMLIISMFDFNLPVYAPFAILACISLGLTIPSAPGGVGVISFATIFSMKLLFNNMGLEITDALYAKIVVFSIIINLVMVLPEIILGTFFAIRTGAKLSSIMDEMSAAD